MDILTGVKVILFDFDGTLYEGTDQFDFYAEYLSGLLPAHMIHPFRMMLADVLHGRHAAIRFGVVVDLARGWVLTHQSGRVTKVTDWEGEPIAAGLWNGLYPDPLMPSQTELYNVGDMWQAVPLCARRYGLSRDAQREAFAATRQWMAGRELSRIPGLIEALAAARTQYRLVLATNSPEEDSRSILIRLGLDQSFDHYLFTAQKPHGFTVLAQEVMERFRVAPFEVLSIGDNLLNEILPARRLGMKAVFIDRHTHGSSTDADQLVESLLAVMPALVRSDE